MGIRPLLPVALIVLSGLSGCADLLGPLSAGNYDVAATPLFEGAHWNRDNSFHVIVRQNVTVRIEVSDGKTTPVGKEAIGDLTVTIPDGTWTVTYWVDGHKWHTYNDVRVDTVPPKVDGLETVADAPDHSYTLGKGATVSDAVALAVIRLADRKVIATTLPVDLTDMPNGLQTFLVSARDEAGNYANATVQVHVGPAVKLPAGQYTFGVVARYSNEVRLWDLTDPGQYLSPAAARAAVNNAYLGPGFGIAPGDDAVKRVVADVVKPEMNTMQAATALYKWFADNLEYDETRLDSDTLLTPHQVILDTEDAAGKSTHTPGLVDDGAGNGVRGGICRDLAATFVSLLRASGIPARLVSGYVGQKVNGFHAWVEFYAGAVGSQSPWVPIDVSTIDGPYTEQSAIQSFGIEHPEYLPLRSVPEVDEIEGWSTALAVHYTWPQGTGQGSPDIQFRKNITAEFSYDGKLCFNPATRARQIVEASQRCGEAYTYAVPDFPRQLTRTIDYGIEVVSAPKGTEVKAEVAYPFESAVEPDHVVYQFYGPAFELKSGKGLADFFPKGS